MDSFGVYYTLCCNKLSCFCADIALLILHRQCVRVLITPYVRITFPVYYSVQVHTYKYFLVYPIRKHICVPTCRYTLYSYGFSTSWIMFPYPPNDSYSCIIRHVRVYRYSACTIGFKVKPFYGTYILIIVTYYVCFQT